MDIFDNDLNKAKSAAILACYSNNDEVVKSEGDRGGHIIGHTKGGEPKYNNVKHSYDVDTKQVSESDKKKKKKKKDSDDEDEESSKKHKK